MPQHYISINQKKIKYYCDHQKHHNCFQSFCNKLKWNLGCANDKYKKDRCDHIP